MTQISQHVHFRQKASTFVYEIVRYVDFIKIGNHKIGPMIPAQNWGSGGGGGFYLFCHLIKIVGYNCRIHFFAVLASFCTTITWHPVIISLIWLISWYCHHHCHTHRLHNYAYSIIVIPFFLHIVWYHVERFGIINGNYHTTRPPLPISAR